ncbi:response regulator [Allohahella marinimesophila]|uniref:histidine kinase n=1 Tax=Allohahella marinimesophila TaxID=1054972 RepID=A0ABP7P2N1_9GAMM
MTQTEPTQLLVMVAVDEPLDEALAAAVDERSRQDPLAGFGLTRLVEAEFESFFVQQNEVDTIPPLVVVGDLVRNEAALIRILQGLAFKGHIFLLPWQERQDQKGRLGHLPLSGLHWSMLDVKRPGLPELLAGVAAQCRQRQNLQRSLSRANSQLRRYHSGPSQQEPRVAISDYYLTSFLTHSRDAVVALDPLQRVLYWSSGAERLFRVSQEEAVGRAAADLPCWSSALESSLQDVRDDDDTVAVEASCRIADSMKTTESVCSPVHDELGRFAGYLIIVRDVTERQQRLEAERAAHVEENRWLSSERQYLRTLFKQAPGFIAVTTGANHVFDLVNDAYQQIIGQREVLGLPAVEALPEMQGQQLLVLLDHVYQSGIPYVGSGIAVRLQRRPGAALETRFVDFVFQPISDDAGRTTGLFWQGSDVTDHKLTRDKLNLHQKNLEKLVQERTKALQTSQLALQKSQKLEAIGQLTGGIAHDFNNVLQIITGSLQLLQLEVEAERLPSQTLQYLKTAVDAVDRGSNLSSQLLAFARRQPLRPVPLNLNRILRNMGGLLRQALGEAIEIDVIEAAGLWNTLADPHQLENVILNLAINARDAMPEGGSLTLELANTYLDEHYVLSQPDLPAGQYVQLAVSDTGTGMTPDVLERAFDPFYTTKQDGKGTGLGLSMAYGFTKQSGGHIRIYSEPGKGTTFKIYLPRSYEAEIEAPMSSGGPVVGGSETILVAEDDPAVRNTAVSMLQKLGYRVLQAEDGRSALSVLKSGMGVEMLFTDVVMPGPVSSTDLVKKARALHPDIRVLYTSGYTQNAIVHGGRLDRGVELLSKPYRREDLAGKVRQMLDARQSEPLRDPGPLHILLVEDDDGTRDAVGELLSHLGHEVKAADSAEAALEHLAQQRFEVLLTDLNLPGMSGAALIKRARLSSPDMQVVVASGQGTEECEGLEPVPIVLAKPYDLASLRSALQQVNQMMMHKAGRDG